MKRSTIAVLGATGYLGGQVLRRLASAGHPLRAGYRADSIRWHVEDLKCGWSLADLRDPASIERLIRGAQVVIHCAGYSPSKGEEILDARRKGVAQMRILLNACIAEGVQKVVYVSSAATVMQKDIAAGASEPRDETHFYLPGSCPDPFMEVKAAMEAEVYRYLADGLAIVMVLPSVLLGPGNIHWSRRCSLAGLTGGRRSLYRDEVILNFSDVRDVTSGVVAALQRGRPGRRYLLTGNNITAGDLKSILDRHRAHSRGQRRWAAAGVKIQELLTRTVAEGSSLQRARQFGLLSRNRASAELGYQCRSLETTIMDEFRWLRRVGYLSIGA